MESREYQRRAVNQAVWLWNHDSSRICVVCPTGGGKSEMARMMVARGRAAGARVLGAVHRVELVRQLVERFGAGTGALGPEFTPRPGAHVQVGTIQTLLQMSELPPADILVVDECHHYADHTTWSRIFERLPGAKVAGFTATPGRADGAPLGDVYQKMVVAASYSELLALGHLVPCEVWHPPEQLSRGIALDPVTAYERYGQGERGFVFAGTVAQCYELKLEFAQRGVIAAVIEADTPDEERVAALAAFRAGHVRLLISVQCLTEGIDVPDASVCILVGGCADALSYLQKVGRVLRAAVGKVRAILIDLAGACLAHGLPTQDREYSLDGIPVRLAAGANTSLRVCLECGFTWEYTGGPCPRCGFVATPKNRRPRIYDVDLRRVYAGSDTPDPSKKAELQRLRRLAEEQHMSVGWIVREYKQLFNEGPPGYMFSPEEKLAEWDRLVEIAQKKGYKPGMAYVRFKQTFGCDPPRSSR